MVKGKYSKDDLTVEFIGKEAPSTRNIVCVFRVTLYGSTKIYKSTEEETSYIQTCVDELSSKDLDNEKTVNNLVAEIYYDIIK